MSIPTDVQQQLAALSNEQRRRVAAIIRRHTEACRRQGAPVELPVRVLKEAIELVMLEAASGQREIEDWTAETIGEGLQQQRYETYRAPAEL